MRKPLLCAALALTLTGPAVADDKMGSSKTPDVSQVAVPRNDQSFAMHMTHHHKQGIALADAVIANGQSDDVKTLARRIRSDQQDDLKVLADHLGKGGKSTMRGGGMGMMAKDTDMQRHLTQLQGAKGADADRLFLETMIAHHAHALVMTHAAKEHLDSTELKSLARESFAREARQVGELQRLRTSDRSASR